MEKFNPHPSLAHCKILLQLILSRRPAPHALRVIAQKMWSYTRESLLGVRKLKSNIQPLENCPMWKLRPKTDFCQTPM